MQTRNKDKIIAVVGPTASAKSNIALRLAHKFNGEIVSADSIQIYKYFDIGSAKPTKESLKTIPHFLIDQFLPDQEYNAALFSSLAQQHLLEIIKRKKTPIIVGGTGLYIKCLFGGLADIPQISKEADSRVERLFQEESLAGCYATLREIDPISAQTINANDQLRILRALKVKWQTGKSIADFQNEQPFENIKYDIIYVGGENDRKQLYPIINTRVLQMIDDGLIEETESIIANYEQTIKPLKSIGYRESVLVINNQISLQEAIETIQTNTRRYAKRQLTWYNKTEVLWNYFKLEKQIDALINQFLEE